VAGPAVGGACVVEAGVGHVHQKGTRCSEARVAMQRTGVVLGNVRQAVQ